MDMHPIDESNPFLRQMIDGNIRNAANIDLLRDRLHVMELDTQKIPTLVETTNSLLAKIREIELDQVIEKSYGRGARGAFDTIHKWTGWVVAVLCVVGGIILGRLV